jgi:hypothetical protein
MYSVRMSDYEHARFAASGIGTHASLVTQLDGAVRSPEHADVMSNKEAATVVPDFSPVQRIVNMSPNPALLADSFVLSTVETLYKA